MHGDPMHQVYNALAYLFKYLSENSCNFFFPGYAPCRVLTGPDFQSVFNLQLWASNAKLINYYMLYG